MTEAEYMRLAIRKAQEGIAAGQSPFGAIIIKDNQVVAVTHNTVWRDCDPKHTSVLAQFSEFAAYSWLSWPRLAIVRGRPQRIRRFAGPHVSLPR